MFLWSPKQIQLGMIDFEVGGDLSSLSPPAVLLTPSQRVCILAYGINPSTLNNYHTWSFNRHLRILHFSCIFLYSFRKLNAGQGTSKVWNSCNSASGAPSSSTLEHYTFSSHFLVVDHLVNSGGPLWQPYILGTTMYLVSLEWSFKK